MIRRIAVVVASRANYGRCRTLLSAIKAHSRLELILIVAGSALLNTQEDTLSNILSDGFSVDAKADFHLSNDSLSAQATCTGLALIQMSSILHDKNPDIVVTIADRYETMATAIAASYQNIPLAHLQGGDISGNIDDKVRHAITRLANYHFPASIKSQENLIKMGEDPAQIFMHGCPSMDLLDEVNSFDQLSSYKELSSFNLHPNDYIVFLMHSCTDNIQESPKFLNIVLPLLINLNKKIVIISPNIDGGHSGVESIINKFALTYSSKVCLVKLLPPVLFLGLIKYSSLCVGNSSSFLREAALCAVPSLILGNRQRSREKGNNCLEVNYPDPEILKSSLAQCIDNVNLLPDTRFGSGGCGTKIAHELASISQLSSVKKPLFRV